MNGNNIRRREPMTDASLLMTISIGIFAVMYIAAMGFLGGAFLPQPFRILGMDVICFIALVIFVVALVYSDIRKRQKRLQYGFSVPSVAVKVKVSSPSE